MEMTNKQVGDDDVVISIKDMLEMIPPLPTEPCISRVSPTLRRVHEEAYTPSIISIGPLHHGKEHLQAMEVHKQRYLRDFLKQNPEIGLEEYVKTLRSLEERVRNCYDERIDLSSTELVKIMLLDGCFLVELFRKRIDREAYAIFGELVNDIFMIENQLPFFVLEKLANQNVQEKLHHQGQYPFQYMIQRNLYRLNILPGFCSSGVVRPSYQVKHFVDLLLQACEPRMSSDIDMGFITIPSATKLHEAGVKFVNKKGGGVTVKFTNGVMEIPTLSIKDRTVYFFRNLIAFEQYVNGSTQYVSDYTTLMDCLIDTADDVALLRKYGIIENWLGSDEEVSELFNKLGNGIMINYGFYFSRLCKDVNAYYNSRWPRWKAKLKRDYFNSPWAYISFFAALMLLIMTFLQTLASVSSWNP